MKNIYTSYKSYTLLMSFLSLLVGFFVFSFYFDYQILNPKNVDWLLSGDSMQNYIGGFVYRKDEWLFPF